MYRFVKSTPIFMILYLLFLIPTYVLPYAGSNSSIGTFVGGAVAGWGGMFPPQWWAHMFVLGVLIVISWVRGTLLRGKDYLPALSLLAAVFDMAPVLRAIPLVPTALHITTIVLGVIKTEFKDDYRSPSSAWREPSVVLGAMIMVTIVGASWSALSVRSAITSPSKSPFVGPQAAQSKDAKSGLSKPASAPVSGPANNAVVAQDKSPPTSPKSDITTTPQPQPDAPRTASKVTFGEQTEQQSTPTQKQVAVTPLAPAKSPAPNGTAAILKEGQRCLANKQFGCAQHRAIEALRVDPGSSAARALLSKAQIGQRTAMDKIEIE